ncbi:hypothetical protein ABAC460_00635 [Asticcacaulis sp. AC460]|uniref:sigma-70 family RNA polymerase sigma factor n=1 Tax=Asticcacaulis sp. AC460 TaxID=1282360 RepID=UPI0003C3DC53|nr:sigma-70 family RNA polymerase sigma factor [Asticcacaulis sp. AC460]ESQ93608.1 hypothetical protein ABAC460_00635 [Asticcacaulis sp. AC460]
MSDAGILAELSSLRPELHRYCARLMGSVIDGEDVVQDAFLRALAALPGRELDAPLRPWLFRIAHNRAMDVLRGRTLRRTEPMENAFAVADDGAEDALARLMQKQAVGLAMARFSELPVMPRSVVILKDVMGESLGFIAALLDLSVDGVKGHLARGRARLRAVATRPVAEVATPAPSPEVARYVALFNARDWDGLRAMLADDARLQQSAYPLRTGPTVREFFGIYAGYGEVRLMPAWVEGREVMAVFEGDAAVPNHMMWLEWDNGQIRYIRDYRYVPYVLAESNLIVAPHV